MRQKPRQGERVIRLADIRDWSDIGALVRRRVALVNPEPIPHTKTGGVGSVPADRRGTEGQDAEADAPQIIRFPGRDAR